MILDDVPDGAGLLVKGAAIANARLLHGGDLDMVNVSAVPYRLKDAVCKSRGLQVLDGLLAEVVVNAIDLVLAEIFLQGQIQFLGGFEIRSERFLHDHARGLFVPGAAVEETRALKFVRDGLVVGRQCRKVKKPVGAGVPL